MSLLHLIGTFFYIGLFAVGGGMAAIALMQQTLVIPGIITAEEFYSMVAISESTPGPIGVNMATYVGCKLYGVWGGVITTASLVLPSLIIIVLIAKFFGKFQEKPLVKAAFNGLRPAVCGMIAVASWQIINIALVNKQAFETTGIWYNLVNLPSVIFYVCALIVLFRTKWHPLVVIGAGAVFGVLFL